MTIAQLIIELSKYDLDQPIYFMDRRGDDLEVHEVREVSLFNPDAPHSETNELSITTSEFWDN